MIPNDLLSNLLEECIEHNYSDLHLSVNAPVMGRLNGVLKAHTSTKWTNDQMNVLVYDCLSSEEIEILQQQKSLDAACSIGATRFRINLYHERNQFAWAIRKLENTLKNVEELQLPEQILELSQLKDGLVLFTGPTGSGKSTSLATLLDNINEQRCSHILTIEDPIEYIHTNKQSLVHQRELGADVKSFASSLKEALREDPDVILVGEMRDLDTSRAALSAAETGHLVFSTLHCADTVGALDRILALYPAVEQDSVRRQLGMTLKAVVAQRLLPRKNGDGRVPAVEILRVNNAVSNLIRTGQFPQIFSILETGAKQGMLSMDLTLVQLAFKGVIEVPKARLMCRNTRYFDETLSKLRKDQDRIPSYANL